MLKTTQEYIVNTMTSWAWIKFFLVTRVTSTLTKKYTMQCKKPLLKTGDLVGQRITLAMLIKVLVKRNLKKSHQNGVCIKRKQNRSYSWFRRRCDLKPTKWTTRFSTHRSPGSTIKPMRYMHPAIENSDLPVSFRMRRLVSHKYGTYWQQPTIVTLAEPILNGSLRIVQIK